MYITDSSANSISDEYRGVLVLDWISDVLALAWRAMEA
jgi:hypothetical protein